MASFRKRLRHGSSVQDGIQFPTDDRLLKKDPGALRSDRFWICVIAGCFFIYIAVHLDYHRFPPIVNTVDGPLFSETNARELLDQLCQFGGRTVGSFVNEVVAPDTIVQRIKTIQEAAYDIHNIEFDVQSTSGCFDLEFLGHFTSCYMNLTNVIAKISPKSSKNTSALLVNCHYDAAISSPGASDDLVSCAIMLEVLRALSRLDTPLKHTIVFNFNGGEETVLQASHGFITKHPWANELKAFVNLEAAGSGGREMIFQTGPQNPWLVSAYAKAVHRPFGSVIGQEIFQSGLIPSDTDFRIYRDFGSIPGIDLAYTSNGYIYHTVHDLPEFIPEGCIQRSGENVLDLLKYLANSDELENPGEGRLGEMVFFDFLGFFMIYYPEKLGEIINAMVVVAVIINLYRNIKAFKRQGKSPYLYMKLIGACYTVHGVALVAMVIVNLLLAFAVNTQRPMMWFTNSWLIVPVYLLPAISVWMIVHQLSHRWYSNIFKLISVWDLESIFFEAALLFWAMWLAILTWLGFGSAYLFLLLSVFPLVFRQFLIDILNIKLYESPALYLSLTASSLVVPFFQLNELFYQLFTFFLPLLGRVGSEVVPDLVVSILTVLVVFVMSVYLAGFLHVSKNQTQLIIKLLVISIIFTLLGCFTGLGFPYNGDPNSPTCQRHVLHHFSREFYAQDGGVEKADHGVIYLPFDYNGAKYLKHIPEILTMEEQKFDLDYAYTGWPYYLPMITLLQKVYTSNMERPQPEKSMKVTSSKELRSNGVIRYKFTTSGDLVYVNIYIAPRIEAELIAWSFTSITPKPSKMPDFIDRPHYFVYTTAAKSPAPNRDFWLDIRIPPGTDDTKQWLDIGFAAHYLSGPDSVNPALEELMSRFPNWTAPIGWTAIFQHYKL